MKKKKILFLCLGFVLSIVLSIFVMKNNLINTYAENHIHGDECYNNSQKHICVGNKNELGGCYTCPIFHKHELKCYSNACNNDIANYELLEKKHSNCDTCGMAYYSSTYRCKLCGATTTISACGLSSCSKYKDLVQELPKNIKHLKLTDELTLEKGSIICGLDELIPIEYAKMCGKEDGKYYNEDGSLATPECGTVVVSWKPEIEQQTEKNQSTKVVVTYMDGHTSTIPATYTTFDSIDKTSFVENYPVEMFFQAKTSVGGEFTEQSVTIYYTNTNGSKENNIENEQNNEEEIKEINEKDIVTSKPTNKQNEITSNNQNTNKNKENVIIEKEKENQNAKVENQNKDDKKDTVSGNKIEDNQENIDNNVEDTQNETNEKNQDVLLVTIVIVVLLITVFVIINVVISNKHK